MNAPRSLPPAAHFEHLRKEAKALVKQRQAAGQPCALRAAQREVAAAYGFKTWAELKARVENQDLVAQLKSAIDSENLDAVRRLVTEHPELHKAPLGYNQNGPLTWAAECRGARPPRPERLAIITLLLDLGSDIHQGGDGPLMRACLSAQCLPVAELLVARGANVNALWDGRYPIVMTPCETLSPEVLEWLLKQGADPAVPSKDYGQPMDVAIGTYGRNSVRQHRCVELLYQAGAPSKYRELPSMDIHRGRLDLLGERIARDPALVRRTFPELEYGGTGHRGLTLKGGTLLHVAAEFADAEAVTFLLARGADPNARAVLDAAGTGGQTPLFHSVTQYEAHGVETTRILLDAGADLSIQAVVPGHYDRPTERLTVTPLGYAARFPYGSARSESVFELLLQRGAPAGDLYAAARSGYMDETRALLAAGADPNARGPDGDSALAAALSRGRRDLADLLAAHGAAVGLPEACALGLPDKIRELLRANPALAKEHYGDKEWTPVHFAAAHNQPAALDALLEFRAPLESPDRPGQMTPLHRAAEAGAHECVSWLLEHGARVEAADWTGRTPLHVAARKGATLALLELLLKHGADLHAVTGGRSAVDLAREGGHAELAQALEARGAKSLRA